MERKRTKKREKQIKRGRNGDEELKNGKERE